MLKKTSFVGLGVLLVILSVVNTIYAVQENKISLDKILIYLGFVLALHIISIWLIKILPILNVILDFLLALAAFLLVALALGISGKTELQATAMALLFLNQGIILIRLPYNIFHNPKLISPSENV